MPPRLLMRSVAIAMLFCCAICQRSSAEQFGHEVNYKGAYARWSNTRLVIGNRYIERSWAVEADGLRALTFTDRETNMQWMAYPAKSTALPFDKRASRQASTVNITGSIRSPLPDEVESLVVTVSLASSKSLEYQLAIAPEVRGVSISIRSDAHDAEHKKNSQPGSDASSMLEQQPKTDRDSVATDVDVLEDLPLEPQHLRFTQVTLVDDTDHHGELTSEREWLLSNNEAEIFARGDLFFAEDVVTGSGLIFLKMAPLPTSRPTSDGPDLHVIPSSRTFHLLGLQYPAVVLAYHGGRVGRIAAMQEYQQTLHPYVAGRDGGFLSNTWGDRSNDGRISEAFMKKEVDAGARLGVDIIQIDDGWQTGRTVNSVHGPGISSSFWSTNGFWSVNLDRFPHGLKPIADDCRDHGMKLGLWYAPDSSHDYENWQRDASEILDFYRRYGIEHFKFDSIQVNTSAGERNLHSLMDRIVDGSQGAITVDLDITAGRRPGYFGLMNAGPLFVENRYTDFHRWWPHTTLRTLWELSQYIDPVRLRMEFLNKDRNQDKYADDPLAPAHYQADAVFATVMVASPLGWFENSGLSEPFVASAAPLIAVWKQERDRLYSGVTIPIGEKPDGVRWTGFASFHRTQAGGYLLLFRELNEDSVHDFPLSGMNLGTRRVKVLAGRGKAQIVDGRLHVEIPETLHYLWVRID